MTMTLPGDLILEESLTGGREPSGEHAILGASSCARWVNCPGSINLIASMADQDQDRTTVWSDEGTAAHQLLESCILEDRLPASYLGSTIKGKLKDWLVTQEMVDAVQVGMTFIQEEKDRLEKKYPGCPVYVRAEAKVMAFDDREDMFGTTDILIGCWPHELVVGDYKHGGGVVVEVDHNYQMMYYALGALRALGFNDYQRINTVIIQPRAYHEDGPVRDFEYSSTEIRNFGERIRAGAEATKDPNAKVQTGSWCRFCPAGRAGASGRIACEAKRNENQSKITNLFDVAVPDQPPVLSISLPDPTDGEGLAAILPKIRDAKSVLEQAEKSAKMLALGAMQNGIKVPGFKIVAGKKDRVWRDGEEPVIAALRELDGFDVDSVMKPATLDSPYQVEKAIGGKDGKKWVAQYAYKPEGSPTIALEKDKRPALPATVDLFEVEASATKPD